MLRYLGSDLDGPAIARELGVSLSTVRTHTQHIYAKLGVTNRRAAVRRAHQLNLFSRTAPALTAARPGAHRPRRGDERREFISPLITPDDDGSSPPLPTLPASRRPASTPANRPAPAGGATMTHAAPPPAARPGWYEIRLQGRLDPRWSAWLDGMDLTPDGDGTTVLTGRVVDQAALHGLLARLRDLGLPLISVARVEPDQAAMHHAPTPARHRHGEPT